MRRGGLRALPSSPSASRCEGAVPAAGMFRKARRVNVRKRNDSEEEERERDEEQEPPPLLPPPASGDEPGPGGGDRAPAGESLLGPGPPQPQPPPPPPSAHAPGLGAEAGGGIPGGAEPGNGLKPRKRPRENKEVPRASLLSFQDEEEGKAPGRPTRGPEPGLARRPRPSPPPPPGGCVPALPRAASTPARAVPAPGCQLRAAVPGGSGGPLAAPWPASWLPRASQTPRTSPSSVDCLLLVLCRPRDLPPVGCSVQASWTEKAGSWKRGDQAGLGTSVGLQPWFRVTLSQSVPCRFSRSLWK